MQLIRNVNAISGLSLILVLLASVIIGALFSYLWVVGYYENLKIRVPEKSVVTITDATFSPENTRSFNISVLNPSYSLSESANITRIATSTEDGQIHNVTDVDPPVPFELPKATMDFPGNQTFQCLWNWANYTGESIGIIAFLAEGSGPTFEAEAPLVDLSITSIDFNPSVSVTRFNITVNNSNTSIMEVEIAEIRVIAEDGAIETVSEVTPPLPYTLHPNNSVSLVCSWDWTDFQGENVTILVETTQGYIAYYPEPPEQTSLPPPTAIQITEVLFDAANTTSFNVTVTNDENSPTYVNVTNFGVTLADQVFPDLPVTAPPSLPYSLHPGANVTFNCLWNWTNHREEPVEVSVHTQQNFTASHIAPTAADVILKITNASFDVTDTAHFNLTVQNSLFSLQGYVNITGISLKTVEESWRVTDTDPDYVNYPLHQDGRVTFKCEWDWTNYRGNAVDIRVVAQTQNKSYYADFATTTPPAVILNLTDVRFDLSDAGHFNVTVENSEFSLDYVFIMNITTTLESGELESRDVVPSTALPHVLHKNESVNFTCVWDWSNYRGKNVTVTVGTLQGYFAESTIPMPLVITEVLFNATDSEHFTITIQNSMTSVTSANITGITVTVDDGTPENITQVTPSLPHALYSREAKSFSCTWNWSGYEGQVITITIRTSGGYVTSTEYTIPALPPATKSG